MTRFAGHRKRSVVALPQLWAEGKGDKVRVKNEYVPGHVRMPGYIRGKSGVVVRISPPYPFPDTAGRGMQAPISCDVAFNHVGVFQSYLEKIE
jgi:nitrile hydratase subunit beta